ncbi:glycosyltransferase family 39 protein [Roseibium sp. AS2]|uniref:glycosyltransferase family 39 protein n=1 Tax=Roseibium sp. AS2 TaxID=3135781 RepID=UPI00317E4723
MGLKIAARLLTHRYLNLLLLATIVGVAALARLPGLNRTSLWYDEAVSWSQSRGSLTELLSSVASDNYPPLHNIVLWLTMPVLGDSETALRLPSALFGLLAVVLMYLLGRFVCDRWTGLLAAALLAVSPFHIWYSTEARMYALLAATGLAFLLATLTVLRKPGVAALLALAVSGTAFLYTHIYALPGFASVGLVCTAFAFRDLIRREPIKTSGAILACAAMTASTLAFLPWLLILTSRARSVAQEGFWIAYPDLPFLKTMVFNISGSLSFFSLLAGLALTGLVAGLVVTRKPARTGSHRQDLVCTAYTAGPPVLAYLYSVLVQPILFDRYLIAAWPGLLLLAAMAARRLLPHIAPLALLAAALILTFPELRFTLREKVRPEWRLIVQDYLERRHPEDRLVLYRGFAAPALAYYLREPEAFAPASDRNTLAHQGTAGARWLLIVHSNEHETAEARAAFGIGPPAPVARRFGWGASGLSLFEKSVSD